MINPLRTSVATITASFTKMIKQLEDVKSNSEVTIQVANTVIDIENQKKQKAMDEKVKAELLINNINKLIGE